MPGWLPTDSPSISRMDLCRFMKSALTDLIVRGVMPGLAFPVSNTIANRLTR